MNREFVNVWVLNHELKVMREALGLANVAPLPRAIIKGWQPKSPVDCLVISPDLELLGCQPANDLAFTDLRVAYRNFLTASLKGDRPGLNRSATGKARDADDVQELLVELLQGEKFRINGKGPLTRKEARALALENKKGARSLAIQLKADPETVTQERFDAMVRTLHEDWRVFDDIPLASFTTLGMNTGYIEGEEPGLGGQNEPQHRSNISLQGLPRLTIEMVGPGQFKIDGKGPLTAKEARAEAVRVARGKKSILVVLKASPEAISDDEYSAFRESFHDDGGMLEGLDIKGVGEMRF